MDLEAEIRELQRQMRGVPSRFAATSPRIFYFLVMGGGNTVATYGAANYYGLKYNSAVAVTSVPTASPSVTLGALPDNLSAAELHNEDGTISTVWVGNRLQPGGVGPINADFQTIIPQNTPLICYRTINMPIGATANFARVFLPGRLG